MKNNQINDIKNHLECLGYQVEPHQGETTDFLVGQHANWANVMVQVGDGFILVRAGFRFDALFDGPIPNALLDEANRQSSVARWYAERDVEKRGFRIIIEAYAMEYGRESFGRLMSRNEHEIGCFIPKFVKFVEEAQAKKAAGSPEAMGVVIMSPSGNLNPALHRKGESGT